MTDTIQQAIEYADREEHGGAGYTLRVNTTDGQSVEVSVSGQNSYLLTERTRDGSEGNEMFFNPANVTFVEVLW